MLDALLPLSGAVLVNYIVLTQFLRLSPLIDFDDGLGDVVVLALVSAIVLTLTTTSSYLLDHFVLLPQHVEYLRIVAFISVIAVVVPLVRIVSGGLSPSLHRVLHVYKPLIIANCIVLGVAQLVLAEPLGLVDTALYASGAAAGFTLAIAMFAALCERLVDARIPMPFRGAPIVLISAGILSLGFMGFKGIGI
jgi:Na+-translocating ferredoxin:NAD+ oxidoreductase subunit A